MGWEGRALGRGRLEGDAGNLGGHRAWVFGLEVNGVAVWKRDWQATQVSKLAQRCRQDTAGLVPEPAQTGRGEGRGTR